MLQLHKETLHEAGERANGAGSVRFGATLTMAPYLLSHIARWARETTSTVDLEAQEDFTENLLEKLREGLLDFAIMSTPIDEPCMLCRVLNTELFVAILPADHPLSQPKHLTINELLQAPYLQLSEIHCAGQQISDLCRLAGERIHSKMKRAQPETLLRLVRQGAGVTILPRMAIAHTPTDGLEFRDLSSEGPRRDIALVHHQDRYLSPSARALIDVVEDATRALSCQL